MAKKIGNGLTHHFWWYIFHITAPRKLSTLLEGDPYNFKWKKILVRILRLRNINDYGALFYDIQDRQCINHAFFLSESNIPSEGQFLTKKLPFFTLSPR